MWRRPQCEIGDRTMITIRNRFTGAIILERDTLRGADLRDADLSYANLYEANLEGADLGEANLYEARLRRANLTDANLSCANLTDANLVRADLRGADLRGANLTRADLKYANIIRTRGIYTIQLDRDLIIAHASQVQIGCEKHSIYHWLEHYKEIGKNNDYTDKQIEMYGEALVTVSKLIKPE